MKYRILQQLLSLMTCLLLLTAIAINRNHKLLGYDLNEISESYQPTEQLSKNGIKIISTNELANDVMGYGGKTPLHLYIKNDTIIKIDFAQYSET